MSESSAIPGMTRVFENRGIGRTSNISIGVMIAVILFGIWELWAAFVQGSQDQFAAMFGVLFLGGGAIGLNTVWNEGRDQVQWFDADPATRDSVVAVWRPFRPMLLPAPLAAISGWRYWVKIGKRSIRVHYLIATVPGYGRPVYFELPHGQPAPDIFRDIAPGAVAEYEENTGFRPSADGDGADKDGDDGEEDDAPETPEKKA